MEPAAPQDLFELFSAYFDDILERNWILRREVGVSVAFVAEPGDETWIVDCAATRPRVRRGNGETAPIHIRLPRTLLYQAIVGHLHWETFYLSNRLVVRVTDVADLDREWQFWRMLFNFREGLLRDRLRLLGPRGRRVVRHRLPDLIRRK